MKEQGERGIDSGYTNTGSQPSQLPKTVYGDHAECGQPSVSSSSAQSLISRACSSTTLELAHCIS